eukprot:366916_1
MLVRRSVQRLLLPGIRRKSISAHITLSRTEELFVGTKTVNAIQSYASKYNYNRILLIASKTLDTTTNEINIIENSLKSRIGSKITGIQQHNPSTDLYKSILEARKIDTDCIVIIGGGSITDNGKATALLKNETNLNSIDDISKFVSPGIDAKTSTFLPSPISPDNNDIIPVLLVPTTLSGTTHIAGCTDVNSGQKQGFCHPEIIPRGIIFDPSITKYTPEWLWLSTGIRAFDHVIETIMSPYSNPYWNGIATNALKGLLKYLPLCTFDDGVYINENDTEFDVRLECLISSYMAIQSISDGCSVGASHSIGYGLGGFFGVPHGYTSCVMTPYVMKYNLDNDKDNKYGCRHRSELIKNVFIDVFGNDELFDKTKDVANMMHDFINGLGLPRTLGDVGVEHDRESFERMAKYVINVPWTKANPVPITEEEQILYILNMAQSANNLNTTFARS